MKGQGTEQSTNNSPSREQLLERAKQHIHENSNATEDSFLASIDQKDEHSRSIAREVYNEARRKAA